MRIICVDDEELVLQLTLMMCRSLSYVDQAEGFTSPADALAWLDENEADAALLDIDMPEMSGLALAAKIKEKYPDISVVFTTGYAQFAVDAFALHASGYLMKPLSKERIDEELRYARENRQESRAVSHLSAVTFGNFDLLIDGRPLSFPRSKS
ncbi:MAG: response regulator, partial [Firmicutes bacterium]|nr:response regulator [Bacillota bacterium]